VSPSFGACAYVPQAFPASVTAKDPGVRVVDARDPRRPKHTVTLRSPAMLTNPWESLKVHPGRGLLVGTSGTAVEGVAFLDVYALRPDCGHPVLLNSIASTSLALPANLLGHEGGFSPDGRTYWASGGAPGMLTAIDLSNPRQPRVLTTSYVAAISHGLSLSQDGRTLYLSTINPNGLLVLDVGAVQDRLPLPQLRAVGSLVWGDGANAQHTVPIRSHGRPYLIAADEQEQGTVRVLDITDPRTPRLVAHYRLEIHLPSRAAERAADDDGTFFQYEAHYCAVDRPVDPRRLACGFFESGVRVFDITSLTRAREVAYYNPPAQTGKRSGLTGSEHANGLAPRQGSNADLTTDWCTSPPRFVGRDQLWVTCQDGGFMVLRFT
jgi:hypothetical protein